MEGTQRLPQFGVCEICWHQAVIKVCSWDKEFSPYPLNSNFWFIPTGLSLGRGGFKGYNIYFRSDFPWETGVSIRSCLPLTFLVFQGLIYLFQGFAQWGYSLWNQMEQSPTALLDRVILDVGPCLSWILILLFSPFLPARFLWIN